MRSPLRRRLAVAFAALVLLSAGCSSAPSKATAVGTFQEHNSAGWGLVLPEGWQAHGSSSAMSLVRRLPYEGGYPTLNVRRLGDDEVHHYPFEGRAASSPAGEVRYQYQKWRNTLGRGYRLEGILNTPDGVVFFIDASIWDTAMRVNDEFFDTQFWPIVNSIRVTKR